MHSYFGICCFALVDSYTAYVPHQFLTSPDRPGKNRQNKENDSSSSDEDREGIAPDENRKDGGGRRYGGSVIVTPVGGTTGARMTRVVFGAVERPNAFFGGRNVSAGSTTPTAGAPAGNGQFHGISPPGGSASPAAVATRSTPPNLTPMQAFTAAFYNGVPSLNQRMDYDNMTRGEYSE